MHLSLFHQIQNVSVIRSIILRISKEVKMLPKNNDVPSTVKCIPMAEMLKCGKIGLMESMKYVPASGAKIYRDMI